MKQEKIKKNQCGGKRICARKTIPISFFDFQNRAPNLIFLIVPVLSWWEPASVDSGKSACQNVCALQTSHLFKTLKGHTRKVLLDGKFLLERKTTIQFSGEIAILRSARVLLMSTSRPFMLH